MSNTYSLENLEIPNYPEDRIYLNDPSEVALMGDIALSMEVDLNIVNNKIAFESLDLGYPSALLHVGMENRFTEVAKQGYYKFKQRAKQLVKYVFSFFINFLRGSTDAKAIIAKYSKKLTEYKKAFEKMRPSDNADKEVEIRDVRKRVITTVTTILVITAGLDTVLNNCYQDKSSKPEVKITRFASAISQLNYSIANSEYPSDKLNAELESNKPIKSTSFFNGLAESIVGIFKKSEEEVLKITFDNNKDVKNKLEEMKKLYKEDYDTSKLSHSEVYGYMSKTLNQLSNLIDPKNNDWDFKKIVAKVERISRDLEKEVDKLSSEEVEEKSAENKSTANAFKIIMTSGSYMASVKDIMVVSLKTFKGDMETFFTECQKAGTILYKKQS